MYVYVLLDSEVALPGVVGQVGIVRVLEVGHLTVRLESAVRWIDATHPGEHTYIYCLRSSCSLAGISIHVVPYIVSIMVSLLKFDADYGHSIVLI